VLPEGHGSLVGIFLNIDNAAAHWYGEGDDMIFIDGERGRRRITAPGRGDLRRWRACPTAEYAGPYTGFHLIGNLDYTGKISMYRFYVNDPVRFRKSVRMTIRRSCNNGNDYSSTAFWYQTDPHKPFGPLPAGGVRATTPIRDRSFASSSRCGKLLALVAIDSPTSHSASLERVIKHDISQTYFRRDYRLQARSARWNRSRALLKQAAQ
jgi:hypothetical protein